MQAVYSTTTEVKIHKAIRREWASFHAWLFEQHRRLEHREHELSQGKRGKGKNKQEILGLQQKLLAAARGEWLARVRHSQLHLEHWVMTPDEKHLLQQTLGWTQKEMVDAYVQQQTEMGPMYQRVDPDTLGTKDPADRHMNSPSRFMHPVISEDVPAYANWASELAKMTAASPHRPPKSIKSVELPNMPLYYVGALLQGTDLDAVAASDLEAFALHVSEEKIREYYAEACDASVHFQRILATIEPSRRNEAQEDFERRMHELASVKEREWKAITVKELRKHQAAEVKRRAAQHQAAEVKRRAAQQKAAQKQAAEVKRRAAKQQAAEVKRRAAQQQAQQRVIRPPRRKELRREFHDLEEYRSPPQQHGYLDVHQSPQRDYLDAYRSPRQDHLEAYRSPRRDSLEMYNSPGPDFVDAYSSPRPQPRRRRGRQPVVEEEYAVSLPVDEFPQLRRRNALHRGEVVQNYELSPTIPFGTLVHYQKVEPETGLWSASTRLISRLGAFRPRRNHGMESISSFDWIEPGASQDEPPDLKSVEPKMWTRNKKSPKVDQEWEGLVQYSEEEFPMREKQSRWQKMFTWSSRRPRRNPTPTSSDIGWADRDSE